MQAQPEVKPTQKSVHYEYWVLCHSTEQQGILVWCSRTGNRGIVKKFSQKELEESYGAMHHDLRWEDESRVQVTSYGTKRQDCHASA